MELVQVHVIGAQKAQRRFQILPKRLGRAGLGFSGDGHLIAHALECKADALLAIGLRPRRVEEGHAALERAANQCDGVLLGNALNRQRPERILRRDDTGRSQRNSAHKRSSLNSQAYRGQGTEACSHSPPSPVRRSHSCSSRFLIEKGPPSVGRAGRKTCGLFYSSVGYSVRNICPNLYTASENAS